VVAPNAASRFAQISRRESDLCPSGEGDSRIKGVKPLLKSSHFPLTILRFVFFEKVQFANVLAAFRTA